MKEIKKIKKFVIDVEASGLDEESYPIEIAFVDVYSDEEHCFLIKPYRHWVYWNEDAEEIHGIPREKLLTEGENPFEVAEKIHELIKDAAVFSDAKMYDGHWLNRLLIDSGFDYIPIFDIHDFVNSNKVGQFNTALIKLKTPHRALADAKLIKNELLKFI